MTTYQAAINAEILSRLNDIYDLLKQESTRCNEQSLDWLPGTDEYGNCIRPLNHPGPCYFVIVTASPISANKPFVHDGTGPDVDPPHRRRS